MSEKNVILRLGNFVVSKETGNGMDWVSVKASSGFWTVRYREDSSMYGTLMMLVDNESLHPYLDGWIHALYAMAATTPDLDFYQAFYEAYAAMNARREEVYTEEEHKAALEEDKALYEMKNEQREAETTMDDSYIL